MPSYCNYRSPAVQRLGIATVLTKGYTSKLAHPVLDVLDYLDRKVPANAKISTDRAWTIAGFIVNRCKDTGAPTIWEMEHIESELRLPH